MTKRRYQVNCREGCEIEADLSDDGLFDRPTAERRAGFHEGSTGHSVDVEAVEETPEYRCPVCHTKCTGKRERDDHAQTEPGVRPDSFTRV